MISTAIMSVLWTRARRGLACAPSRLYRALPSVLLGILLNTLDTSKYAALIPQKNDWVLDMVMLSVHGTSRLSYPGREP